MGSTLQSVPQPPVPADETTPPDPGKGFNGLYNGTQIGTLVSGTTVTQVNQMLAFVVQNNNIGPGVGTVSSSGFATFMIDTFVFTGTFTPTGAAGTWTQSFGGVTGSGTWQCGRTIIPGF